MVQIRMLVINSPLSNPIYLGISHGVAFNLIPSCMESCNGQIPIETATYSFDVHCLWVTLTSGMEQMNILFYFFFTKIDVVEVIHILQSDDLSFLSLRTFQLQW